ncbi:MAG: hypothetical protein OEN20_02265 [Gammaproteobacteria bacterium]|nr:hypothetical protein [Gammaproteobacteria bacterium]
MNRRSVLLRLGMPSPAWFVTVNRTTGGLLMVTLVMLMLSAVDAANAAVPLAMLPGPAAPAEPVLPPEPPPPPHPATAKASKLAARRLAHRKYDVCFSSMPTVRRQPARVELSFGRLLINQMNFPAIPDEFRDARSAC